MNDFNCNDADNLILEYTDGTIDYESKQKFETHLAECEKCGRSLQASLKLPAYIADAKYPLPLDFHRLLMQKIRQTAGTMKAVRFKNRMLRYGSIAAAFIIVTVGIYFGMTMENRKMGDSISSESGYDSSYGSGTESYATDNYDIIAEEATPEATPEAAPIAPAAQEDEMQEAKVYAADKMNEYLTAYAPDYTDTAKTLYIYRDGLKQPEIYNSVAVLNGDTYTVIVTDDIIVDSENAVTGDAVTDNAVTDNNMVTNGNFAKEPYSEVYNSDNAENNLTVVIVFDQ
jgi:hypothetical protein